MVLKSEKRQRKILINWGKEVLLKKKMKKRKLRGEMQQDSWPLRTAALSMGSPGGPRHACLEFSQDTDVD